MVEASVNWRDGHEVEMLSSASLEEFIQTLLLTSSDLFPPCNQVARLASAIVACIWGRGRAKT